MVRYSHVGVMLSAAVLAAVFVASCGGEGQAGPPTVTQTVVVGPPTSAPTTSYAPEPGETTPADTLESRAVACRELKYYNLSPVTEKNADINAYIVWRWYLANQSNDDPRWLGCVVEDPTSPLGQYVASTHLFSDVAKPPEGPYGMGSERTFVTQLIDRQQLDGNWVNVVEQAKVHMVFHRLPPYTQGVWLLRGVEITARSTLDSGDMGPGGTYGTM
ncbi:hypothetical protein [Kribbella sindirgiensis]|uniref:Lipoprotein n=1 Tax=Kribbella sindirgiensis TaxID=1124744 RepID=A0A4R0I1Q1_9ACTN|nr:hypothetical protein [Kribbella sindirgiensis]TCC21655.1 hypothetical protein E0H50_35865 [Kribbella sindirgiensis]